MQFPESTNERPLHCLARAHASPTLSPHVQVGLAEQQQQLSRQEQEQQQAEARHTLVRPQHGAHAKMPSRPSEINKGTRLPLHCKTAALAAVARGYGTGP